MGGECCLSKDAFNHEAQAIHEALGVEEEEKEKVDEIIFESLKNSRRMSELIEKIWTEKCGELSLQARVYGTIRIAIEVFSMYLEGVARRVEEEGGVKSD